MAKCKLKALKKEVKSHLKEDMHGYKEGISEDKELIKKMKGKAYSSVKRPKSTASMRKSSRSR